EREEFGGELGYEDRWVENWVDQGNGWRRWRGWVPKRKVQSGWSESKSWRVGFRLRNEFLRRDK
ncbi:Hypothetical predicted protein, partial [Prunus dulcis]